MHRAGGYAESARASAQKAQVVVTPYGSSLLVPMLRDLAIEAQPCTRKFRMKLRTSLQGEEMGMGSGPADSTQCATTLCCTQPW